MTRKAVLTRPPQAGEWLQRPAAVLPPRTGLSAALPGPSGDAAILSPRTDASEQVSVAAFSALPWLGLGQPQHDGGGTVANAHAIDARIDQA